MFSSHNLPRFVGAFLRQFPDVVRYTTTRRRVDPVGFTIPAGSTRDPTGASCDRRTPMLARRLGRSPGLSFRGRLVRLPRSGGAFYLVARQSRLRW